MSSGRPKIDDLLLEEAFNSAPDYYDIPEELEKQIQEQVTARERIFWLRASRIDDNLVTRSLLRRALYAEVRCWESENRLAELVLIAQGAKERVEELERKLDQLSRGIDDADL